MHSRPRTPARSPSRSPRTPIKKASPRTRDREIRRLEEEYPELISPDIQTLRETCRPGKESTVGDPLRLMAIQHRDPNKMSLIEKLRVLKRQAITDCDFDKSNAIQKYIELKVITDIDGVIEKAKVWLQEGIETAIENYDSNVDDIQAEAADKKIRIRTDCANMFQEMRGRHINELEVIYMEQEIAVEREENRLPSEYRGMKRMAQKLAHVDETEAAKEVNANAEEVRRAIIEARQEEIKKGYEKVVDQTIKKQQEELEGLQVSLASLLNECDRGLALDLENQKRKVAVYIRHSQSVAVQSSCDWVERVEARTRISSELNQFVKNLLKEMKREDLLSE